LGVLNRSFSARSYIRIVLVVVLGVVTLRGGAQAQGPYAVKRNNQGVELLEQEKSLEAQQSFIDALMAEEELAEAHYNLGIAFEGSKEEEKAIKEYKTAAKMTEHEELKFSALFNAAKLSGEMENVDGALDLYQQALDIQPDSDEVRKNIQILMMRSQGGGQSGEQEQKEKDNQDGEEEKEKPQEPQQDKPQEFKSKQLSKEDVRRILDELGRQEEKIRNEVINENQEETPVEKDW
jgi:tetratricopeptide (TPR) repeat protein